MSENENDLYFGRLNRVSVLELARALGATDGLGSTGAAHEDRARRMFARITAERKPETGYFYQRPAAEEGNARQAAPVRGDWWEARDITVRELDEALQRVGWSPWPGLPVVVSDILAHREPEWKTGDIVRSTTRARVYIRQPNDQWKDAATGCCVDHNTPSRPLTKIGVAT